MSANASSVDGKHHTGPLREVLPSLTVDIPKEILSSVMKILAKQCVVSYVNAKASSKLLRNVGCSEEVVGCLRSDSIPLFAEDNPSVQGLIENAAIAGNLKAVFRIGFLEFFGYQGNFTYGFDLMLRAAREGLGRAIYVSGIILAARSNPVDSEDGRLAEE